MPSEGESSHEEEEDAQMNEPEGDEEPEDEDSAQEDDDDEDEDDGVLDDPIMLDQQARILDDIADYGMEEAEDDYDEEEPVND